MANWLPTNLLDSQFAILERPMPDEAAQVLRSDEPPAVLCGRAVDWLENVAAS